MERKVYHFARKVHVMSSSSGLDLLQLRRTILNTPRFLQTMLAYGRASRGAAFPLRAGYLFPILTDFNDEAGIVKGHYFHQDLWAARKIFMTRPAEHIDVGSRLDGFVAHVLTFVPVTAIDIRPLRSHVPGLTFVQEDATTLSRFADNSV